MTQSSHSPGQPFTHRQLSDVRPDPPRPGRAFLQQEIRTDRRAERWLVPQSLIGLLAVVGLLVVGWLT